MTIALLGGLAVLALIDSTSFGTLVIPLWLLASPGRVRVGRVLVFLATVALFYWSVGLVLLWGAGWAFDPVVALVDSPAGAIALVAAGAALIVWSFRLEKAAKQRKRDGVVVSGRISRWRARAVGAEGGGGLLSLVGLALAAALVEVGSMLPYLAAIGTITALDLATPARVAVLAGYCLVMVAPALVLLVARVAAAGRIEPALGRLEGWLTRNAGETLSWIVGIIGVLLVVNAAGAVELPL